MSLLNVGSRALLANQVALQTAGHNIANVNTPGYSRQSVALQTVQGQFTGSGYIGKGVDVQTILRNQSELLTRQSAAAGSVQSADTVRAERLRQLQEVFSGGTTGLGAAINDMMNSFSDVVNAPTDITARTVALTRMDETASRMRSAFDRINEIHYATTQELNNHITVVNELSSQIASVNEQIASANGNGQNPNDLLDKRDQLIRDLNQYVQTTQIAADDGTVGIFVAGSQPLVLGNTATKLSLGDAKEFPGSGQLKLFFTRPGVTPIQLDENMLGGGSVSGLLRFNNTDLAEGNNLLGRMALAIGTTMNYQQTMGLTLDGEQGKPLFATPPSINGYTSGKAVGSIDLTDTTKFSPTQFAASDYEVRFDATGTGGQVVRLSDGKVTAFTNVATLAATQIDGLTFNFTAPGAAGAPNERVLFKPFASAAANIKALVYSPRDLAAANPINAKMGASNGGSMQLVSLKATDTIAQPSTGSPVTITFQAGPPATYLATHPDPTNPAGPPVTAASGAYLSGAKISINGWEIILQGTPKTNDTVTVGNALDPLYSDWYQRDAGNASALMALRDLPMFDNATLSDGYAQAIAQVGTRSQSANFAAEISTTIAANLERDRTAVSGVNLDEEAAKLIQYQQAYQASAKMLQIAQNIFDNLIQTMSR